MSALLPVEPSNRRPPGALTARLCHPRDEWSSLRPDARRKWLAAGYGEQARKVLQALVKRRHASRGQ